MYWVNGLVNGGHTSSQYNFYGFYNEVVYTFSPKPITAVSVSSLIMISPIQTTCKHQYWLVGQPQKTALLYELETLPVSQPIVSTGFDVSVLFSHPFGICLASDCLREAVCHRWYEWRGWVWLFGVCYGWVDGNPYPIPCHRWYEWRRYVWLFVVCYGWVEPLSITHFNQLGVNCTDLQS